MSESDRSTARGTVKLALAQLVMAGCGVATHIYLTSALQPKLYGVLAVVTSGAARAGARAGPR